MSIKSRLRSFISSTNPGALVLRGSWGRGKTHFWRSLVQRQKPQRYAYVSLFGINSLDDLKDSLSIAEEDLTAPASEESPSSWASRLKTFGRKNKKETMGAVKQALDTDALGAVLKRLVKAAAFYRVKNLLVCLDDIERLGDGLKLKDVLGLVSTLWEQRACRVVVILNTNYLGEEDRKTWEENKEKVFQSEMEFDPSPETCVGLVFDRGSSDGYDQNATQALLDLDITNIRIAERVRMAIEQVKGCLEGEIVSEYTKRRIVRTLTWGVYCLNGRAEGAPPLEDSSQIYRLRMLFAGKEATRTEEQKRWDAVIERYKPELDRSLDTVLLGLVEKGYTDDLTLKQHVLEFDADRENEAKRQHLDEVWDDFHNSFTDNRDDIVAKLRERFPAAVGVLAAYNLDQILWLLHVLNEDTLSDEFIEQWIAVRRGERFHELNLRDNPAPIATVRDQRFAMAIESAYRAHRRFMPLEDAISELESRSTKEREEAIETMALTATSKCSTCGQVKILHASRL